jgi:pSer/pThr/pTyr-binding forkhead associated (FHA) protein
MVLIRPDGSEGGAYPLQAGANTIGRETDPLFENDFYLSPRHVEITIGPGEIKLRDLDSLNGVFFKIFEDRPIEDGQIFRIGQELLRFDSIAPPEPLPDGTEIMGSPNPGYWGRIVVVAGDGVDGSAYLLKGDSVVVGRENGDIQFPEDGYVSGTHLRISHQDARYTLTDLNSSNGTFVRIDEQETVPPGTFVLVGQQLFRVEVH